MKNINEERIMKCISIPSIFTVSEEFLKFYSEVAKKNNMYIHIMVSETKEEVEYCKKNYGCSPIEKLEKLGLLTDKTILAYCVHVDDKDIELIKKYKCAIAHCPSSNFKLKSGLMPFQKLLDAGILITLGTDSSASNNTVSMLEEMKISALNAKLQANKSSAGNVKDIFNTATLNGAKSYGINAGEIKEGKLADFVLYNLNHYLLLPNYNLLSNLVYSAQNDCITDVFCNGIQLMKDRKVEGEEKIMKDFRELSEKYRNVTASLGHN
jgi:5-methylthioadenosine/S-adenosylhomocysteine deaminase